MEKEAACQGFDSHQNRVASTATADGLAESGVGVAAYPAGGTGLPQTGSTESPALRRSHGSPTLNATRQSPDVDAIAAYVVQHLAGLLDAKMKITLEIEAEIPSGAPENVVRTVTENCRTLKFDSQGFEEA